MDCLDKDIYQELLQLDSSSTFTKIDHDDAMVATVYKIDQIGKASLILKICERDSDYLSEVHFLKLFSNKISVPRIIGTVTPGMDVYPAVLMQYIPGRLLTPQSITKEIVFSIGKTLANIHQEKASGFGYLNRESALVPVLLKRIFVLLSMAMG